jgi:hypothetical protein
MNDHGGVVYVLGTNSKDTGIFFKHINGTCMIIHSFISFEGGGGRREFLFCIVLYCIVLFGQCERRMAWMRKG